ncbi:MAG: AsmA family protein, partial [Gammaproteobacteria bacterium]
NLAIEAEDIKATFAGDIAWPIASGTEVRAQIETASLHNLRRWLPGDLLDPGPVSLAGNIEFLASGDQQVEFSARVGDNDLSGTVKLGAGVLPGFGTVDRPSERVEIVGQIESTRLNFMEVFPAPERTEESKTAQAALETKGSVFSNALISLDWMTPLLIDIDFRAGELVTRRFKATNLVTDIDIAGGVLILRSDAGEFSGGSFNLDLRLDSNQKPYPLDLDFSVEGLVAREIPALANLRLPLTGSVDVDIQVASRGISLKEWASKANGEFKVSGLNTYFPSTGMDILTESILAQILGVVNPKKKNEFHIVDCGIVGFRVVDGIVMSRDTIAIQTEEVTFLIRGGISLIDESIVFLIRPKARKGAGISASSFTNFYRVGGTLSDPKIQADLEGVLKTGATWGLAAATGGLSLLAQGLFDKITANQDVCAIAEGNYRLLLEEDGADLVKTWKRLQQ